MLDEQAWIGLRGLGLLSGGAVFWLMYFDLKDRLQPEPRRLLIYAFLIGALSTYLAKILYLLVDSSGMTFPAETETRKIIAYCFFIAAPIEEFSKFFLARAIVFRWKHFDEPIDGLIYSAAVAIGFATVENFYYFEFLDLPVQIARTVTSPLTHSLFAAIWGFGAGHALIVEQRRIARLAWQWIPLILAMLLHGLYNALLLGWGSAASAAAVMAAIWVFVIFYGHRVARRKRCRDFLDE